MSRLNDLLRQVANTDPQLAKDLRRETDALADRRAFGLNFERHTPEAVELPGRPVRKNDKVRILPERGKEPRKEDERLYRVTRVYAKDGARWADIVALDHPDEGASVIVGELVVLAEFRDPIYPGLVPTGKVTRGGEKPFHTVINSENYHALQALLFTHRGKVDAIYIDPPYNSGARDWKYNNDYIEPDDHYRHSKWLAMMERRLNLARELLKSDDSVLIVTIDEREYLRLGLLLEQAFPEARIQMISSIIAQKGVARGSQFYRTDEYIFFVQFGKSNVQSLQLSADWALGKGDGKAGAAQGIVWSQLRRSGTNSLRADRPGLFYPIYIDPHGPMIVDAGSSPRASASREDYDHGHEHQGLDVCWPLRSDGVEGNWQISASALLNLVDKGYVRVGKKNQNGFPISYLKRGSIQKIETGQVEVIDRDPTRGHVIVDSSEYKRQFIPGTQWNIASHDATYHGSQLLSRLIGSAKFPFPKSLYAVEDCLRFFVADRPGAVILDFFAGSGTTAHAVMRLNHQDGGHRQCISVTNNEVSADEQAFLRNHGARPGDAKWEALGICAFITKPRIEAAVTGKSPDGEALRGDYKFADEFPMSDGFEENVEFFDLTYESAIRVSANRDFAKIAPFLWLRAGSRGRRIDDISTGWDVADAYGVIADLDLSEPFIEAVESQEGLTHAFIVTDEDRLFEALVRQLPEKVETVRLYSSYLRNFEIEAGRAAR